MATPGDYNEDLARSGVLLVPAGLRVYGWGYEAETRLALTWLTERVTPGCSVLDVGTGTGILAIHAARLGASVVAYESDPAAAAIAAENIALNDVTVDLRAREYDGADGFDLVVANLGQRVDYEAMGILGAGTEVWTTP